MKTLEQLEIELLEIETRHIEWFENNPNNIRPNQRNTIMDYFLPKSNPNGTWNYNFHPEMELSKEIKDECSAVLGIPALSK
ncbi:hypothetical protein [Daejeonella oryzae]|uniref:hypothetical protein n=1 Tax=Daejeonella oryzae TaxID=1122943 RepID=UPI0004036897|nr:hypothetical protein [Daejeonella oryzae]